MDFIESIKKRVKDKKRTIILPEASDLRVLEAGSKVTKEGFAKIIFIGNRDDINKLANDNKIDIKGIEIIDPLKDNRFDKLVNKFYELRKEKGMTLEEANRILKESYLYYGCMLIKMGYADGQVSGAIHSSSDTLRPALQIIKTKKDIKVASSFFLMDVPNCTYGENGVFVFSDCGLNQDPSSEELVEIAKVSADTFKLLVEKEPYVAFLSHSTFGTSKCELVDKVVNAKNLFGEKYGNSGIKYDGELQLDAAIVPEVAKLKAPNSKVAGHANTLIFPNLDAGNIGYKLVERLGKAKAYGPITQGLAKPVNDLSRGCNSDDIVGAVAITALQVED
jgi:phosphate acetyltransferase